MEKINEEVKDKEWLKYNITKEIQDLFSTTTPNYFDYDNTNKAIRKLVDKLDEPDEREQLETAYKDILSRGEFLFDDKRYVVVEEEPETIASVIVDFFKAAERLKEIGAIEVEELEE